MFKAIDYKMFAAFMYEELFTSKYEGKLRLFPMPAWVTTIVVGLISRTISMSEAVTRLIEGLQANWFRVGESF